MKDDIANYVCNCHVCQINKAKYRPRRDEMVTPEYSDIPFETIHLDIAEIKKRAEGVKKTQAFIIDIDEFTCIVADKARREDTNSLISLMERGVDRPFATRSKKMARRKMNPYLISHSLSFKNKCNG